MASESKKGKTKWKQIDTSQLFESTPIRKITNWADESNDSENSYQFSGQKAIITLPTAPRASRDPENDATIPHEPPFEAFLSNLSYEVIEEDLADFFAKLKVKSVRLPRDDRDNTRSKGFGYIEFEDRNSLIEALNLQDTNLKHRQMRIDVADGDQRRGRPKNWGPNESDRTMGNWRSGLPSVYKTFSSDDYRSGPRRDYGDGRSGARRGYRNGMDSRDYGGSEARSWRRDFEQRFQREPSRDTDQDKFKTRPKLNLQPRSRPSEDSLKEDLPSNSAASASIFGNAKPVDTATRDQLIEERLSKCSKKLYMEPEREPNKDEDKDKPKTRTKLNLQPRTLPVEERFKEDLPSARSASISGNSYPVDNTAFQEQLVEERLSKSPHDCPVLSQDETKKSAQPTVCSILSTEEDEASTTSSEPKPIPKENIWAQRSQHVPSQTNLLQEALLDEETRH